MAYPTLQYKPPHPTDHRVTLGENISAYVIPDTSLDLVDVKVYFRSDNLPEKPEQASEHYLYGALLKTGGTKNLKPSAIEDSLEYVAAHLSAGVNNRTSTLSFNAMSKDIPALFGMSKEIVQEPAFDKDVFKLNKKKYLEAIRHRFDKPNGVLRVAYENIMVGPHASNWMASEQEVESVEPKDLKKYIGLGFQPYRMVIAASGNFKKQDMVRRLKTWAAQFPLKDSSRVSPVPAMRGPDSAGVYVIPKEFSQTTLKIGFPGVQRPHPDYYRLTVASYIFGSGGFGSRLVAKIRTEEGLAYVVRSFVESDYFERGTVGMYLQTKVESGARAVMLCFQEMAKMADSGITDEELQSAKDGLIQSLPSLFKTPSATADMFAVSEVWNRHPDHFERYPKVIEKMTKKEVEDAFKRYFVKEKARVVIVGDDKKLFGDDGAGKKKLESVGPIRVIPPEKLLER